jgi:hypothetical protein
MALLQDHGMGVGAILCPSLGWTDQQRERKSPAPCIMRPSARDSLKGDGYSVGRAGRKSDSGVGFLAF